LPIQRKWTLYRHALAFIAELHVALSTIRFLGAFGWVGTATLRCCSKQSKLHDPTPQELTAEEIGRIRV
jgi:hypothetical protein